MNNKIASHRYLGSRSKQVYSTKFEFQLKTVLVQIEELSFYAKNLNESSFVPFCKINHVNYYTFVASMPESGKISVTASSNIYDKNL